MNTASSTPLSIAGDATRPVVVKLGGRTQADAALPQALAALTLKLSQRVVIVHGGGDQISSLQRMRGEEPLFVGGRRVTTDTALELVRMVLSGLANKQLVSALTAVGVAAVGISGEDASMLRATPIDVATFGHSGLPSAVDVRLIKALLAHHFVPVISPVATHADASIGGALNVNGDDAAAAIAVALNASELFFLADVPGVLDAHKQRIATLPLRDAQDLVASGVAGGGMAAKLDACERALAGGVGRVRIGDLAALARGELGTRIVITDHARTAVSAH